MSLPISSHPSSGATEFKPALFDHNPIHSSSYAAHDATRDSQWPTRFFVAAISTVAAISAYDAYLVFKYRHAIEEQNPICDWLIQLEPEYVTFFLLGKGLGTLAVLVIVTAIFRYAQCHGNLIASSLLVFQFGLLGYLHTSESPPRTKRVVAQINNAMNPIEFAEPKPKLNEQNDFRRNPKSRWGDKRVKRRRAAWERHTQTGFHSNPVKP